jgi:hypothetical protein
MVCDLTDALFQGGRWWAQFLAPDHGPALQTLFERCADYFELEFGLPPGPTSDRCSKPNEALRLCRRPGGCPASR